MKTVHTIADLRSAVRQWRRADDSVALIPTMGALHDGHLSLVTLGRVLCDRTVATIFVNPAQFGENEDLDAYPSNLTRDTELLTASGADLLFAPAPAEIYPDGFSTTISVGGVSGGLCGAARPGHFDGVATVVTKLLLQSLPDKAIFGEKDYQQLQVIRRLAADLDIPVEIIGGPTVREADGLALSSRNAYLSEAERRIAPVLYRTLNEAVRDIAGSPADVERICRDARRSLIEAGFAAVDYFELRDAETLAPMAAFDRPARLFAAAHLGKARLIDNLAL